MPPYENPYDGRSPIIGPMMRAQQLFAMIEEAKQRKLRQQMMLEERDYERGRDAKQDARQAEMDKFNREKFAEETAYRRRGDAVDQAVKMGQLGANPITDVGDLWFDKNQGAFVPSVTGEKTGYKLRSDTQNRARMLEDIIDKGKLDAANAIMMQRALLPGRIAEIEGRERYQQQYATPPTPRIFQTEQGGVAVDPRTGARVWEDPGLAKSPGKSSSFAGEMDKFEAKKSKAQESLRKAQTAEALLRDPATDEETKKKAKIAYEAAIREARQLEEDARNYGKRLSQLSKGKVEYGEDEHGNPYVKPRE